MYSGTFKVQATDQPESVDKRIVRTVLTLRAEWEKKGWDEIILDESIYEKENN